ncbi:nuclear transport factor 2 family protein [Paenibacillus anaericanus]|uniref:Nuclear transport factor 2 family protein n=1 Tax=Paenibacillus anaericanus TaxID=170367 RepID=A0A433YEE9_9BACL|nr:nuclear transport factor 2 family protein [Paenibacillus anaericanus]RUT48237.1 nuclear transport factor 2 family protein [Paenibacillus anaericanus]
MDHNKSDIREIQIICAEDCGNAPKKQLLKDFNIAFARNDIGFILENITDNVKWNLIGDKVIQGRSNFAEELKQMNNIGAIELEITNILTHGNTGAAHGILRFENLSYAFCDVYIFSSSAKNAKIKEITSYNIEVS